jgi:penicillin-binding protein 2
MPLHFFRRTKEYRISPNRDEWVVPEETLVDTASPLSDIEIPVSDGVFRAAYWATGFLALAVIGGTIWLTTGRYTELAALAWRNRTVNVSVPPPRGIILDRNGVPLVQNMPSFDLLVISRQVRRTDDGTFADMDAIASALGREPEELTLGLNDAIRSNAVFFLATDISRDAVLTLNNILPPGFYLITSTKRHYRDGLQLSHVLGYVGKVSRADIAGDQYYLPSDTVGRLGIEASYERVLRGEHGQLVFASAQNAVNRPATPGSNVVLNIDLDVQKALHSAVDQVLREAGLSQGTAIVQDPMSGAVLGMVSFPTYDNNIFSGPLSQADVEVLFHSRTRPLFNRAIAGLYNPGSTIKPFIGMAALQEEIVRADQVVAYDCVSITIPNPQDPGHPYVFENWRPDHGAFDLKRAIADSCNVYFFTVGGGFGSIGGLGAERIVSYLQRAYADRLVGIDIPGEGAGFVPTPDWKWSVKKEPWYQGDTYNISIGQGDLLVTPLWINSYVSAIANGGTIWRPTIAARVVDASKNTLDVYPPVAIGALPFSAQSIKQMQEAMRATVRNGTASILQDVGVSVAAKTGTAEVGMKGGRVNALLTAYAPAEDPKIALTVLVEGSHQNQGYALRVANQFLRWYFLPTDKATPPPIPSVPASSSSPVVSPVAI